MRALQPWMHIHSLEYFQIKIPSCIKTSCRCNELQCLSFFQLQGNEIYFTKFCRAGECFCWLPNSIIIILYSKYRLDCSTGNADFFLLSAVMAAVNFILQITSFVLDLLQFFCTWKNLLFKKGRSGLVGWIYFIFWLHCGCALNSFSLFSMTSFPFSFPTAVKLPDALISFPVLKAHCKQVKGWKAAFAPADTGDGRTWASCQSEIQIGHWGLAFLLLGHDGTLMLSLQEIYQ